ncbi:MAG: recombinase family protein [Oliverpabstia sp.]
MGKIYGYARVSTKTQRLDRQIKNINDYCKEKRIEHIFKEKYTGTKTDRPQFRKLLSVLQEGDTVIFDSVSRMSRNAEEGYELYMELLKKGIDLVFLKEPHINTSYYKQMQAKKIQIASTGKKSADSLIQSILNAITYFQNEETKEKIRIAFEQAEKEVKDLHVRISEGIKTTQQMNKMLPEGQRKQIGQKKGSTFVTKKSIEMKKNIRKMSKDFDGNMKDIEILNILPISRNTYYRYKKELSSEI